MLICGCVGAVLPPEQRELLPRALLPQVLFPSTVRRVLSLPEVRGFPHATLRLPAAHRTNMADWNMAGYQDAVLSCSPTILAVFHTRFKLSGFR